MNISNKFLHDRSALTLTVANIVVAFITILSVLLRVNSSDSTSTIIQYRSNLGAFAFKSGSTADLQSFALFAFVSTGFCLLMTSKFFSQRRHLSVALLSMQLVVLIITLVTSNSLITVN